MADAQACPVTIGHPVPPKKSWREALFGWEDAFGTSKLWVGALWPHGVVYITPDNVGVGSQMEVKFGWYRLTNGSLSITGHRIDAQAPPLSAHTSGYGQFGGFNASSVAFPTEGCWSVTGRVGRATLTFVAFVIKGHCDRSAVPARCVADRA